MDVERVPCWGGAFERLVRSTKRCLRKLIGRAQFSSDELVTTLAEIESVVNSRPLTYISAGDTEEPLTPSHLIVGRRILNLPDHLSHLEEIGDEEFSLNPTQLTRRMKHLANVHDEHLPHGLWKIGKIMSVMKGRDNLIRGATVKIGNKDGRKILLN